MVPPPDRRPDAPQRIAKLLARAGIASRREIERMIAEGRVARNGVPLETPATVLVSLDGVTVDGAPVAEPAPARLFLYHKPPGLLVTERDPGGRATIYDRLPRDLPRVVPVGRLDLATEGLLLLTTDGSLKRQLELPATGVQRAYRARAYGAITQARLEDLSEGVEIDGMRYGPIDANLERRTGANVWIELILTEGKNREVRRVLDHLGLKVSRLIRTRYGPFLLGDLPPGAVGEVAARDVAAFRRDPRAQAHTPRRAPSSRPERVTIAPPGERMRAADRDRVETRAAKPPPTVPVRGAHGSVEAPRKASASRRVTRADANRADRAAFADVGRSGGGERGASTQRSRETPDREPRSSTAPRGRSVGPALAKTDRPAAGAKPRRGGGGRAQSDQRPPRAPRTRR